MTVKELIELMESLEWIEGEIEIKREVNGEEKPPAFII